MLGADVAGLQEVRPGQRRYLRRRLPDAQLLGVGRNAYGGGESATVLVRAGSAWTVESSETRWLSRAPKRRGSRGWDAGRARVVTFVRLRGGGARIGIANTHFDDRGAQARCKSAELLVAWLAGEPDRAWVVLGDLNAVPDSAVLQTFHEAGYRDALADIPGGTAHFFTGTLDGPRIDHILVGPGISVVHAKIVRTRPLGRLPSDHWPVAAQLVPEPERPGDQQWRQ